MMVPLGLQLSQNLGLINLPAPLAVLVWLVGLPWLAIVWLQYLQPAASYRVTLIPDMDAKVETLGGKADGKVGGKDKQD